MTDQKPGLRSIESVPCDFTEFLSRRLNVGPSEAVALLGDYLVEYEPQQRYEIVVGPTARAA